MKKILVWLALLLPTTGWSQVVVSGNISDNKKHPLFGVSIEIKDSYDGAVTDSSGNFRFTTAETGHQVLRANLLGYAPVEISIDLSQPLKSLSISLRELVTELKAVTITAGSFEASDAKKGTILNSLDVATTAGANADIVSALKTLPGAQQVGESEGLFVRGGSATESKIFMDGMLVNNFFYSSIPGIATRGRFNPFLFKGTVFSSGGYSALYGQALSAALILDSKDLPERTEGDLSVSVIGLGGGIQKLAKNKKSAWGATYNYTNLALAFAVIKQKQDYYKMPEYHELDANVRIKTKGGGIIKYYGYLSWNRLGFKTGDVDSLSLMNAFRLENLNTYQNLTWKQNLGSGWRINSGVSFSTNKDNIHNELRDDQDRKILITDPMFYALKNFEVYNRAKYAQVRSVIEKRLRAATTIRFGSEYLYSEEKVDYVSFTGDHYPQTVKDNFYAGFAESDVHITNNLALRLGLRTEHTAILNRWNIAPRTSLAYRFKDQSQASFAWGIFYQNPERRYLPATVAHLDFSKATHYILQYQKMVSKKVFRVEAYYKKYDDLYKTDLNPQTGQMNVDNNNGYGYARGVEFFWRDKKTFKNVDYWISYSYLDTKRDYLNYPIEMQPNFAANHTASLVLKKFVTEWKTGFNASYSFATGRPYYNIQYDAVSGRYQLKDRGKTINYNSLGFSLNYLPNLGKKDAKAFTVLVLTISNVLGQKQVYGYNYSNMDNRKLPITPTAKRFVFIGCFMSFGIDRTDDAIDSNLGL